MLSTQGGQDVHGGARRRLGPVPQTRVEQTAYEQGEFPPPAVSRRQQDHVLPGLLVRVPQQFIEVVVLDELFAAR